MDGRVTPSGIELRLRGIAIGADDDAASDAMAAFVHGLQSSELVTLAQIGGTTREQNSEGRATRQFNLTLTLSPLSPPHSELITFASALAGTERNP
jgi:Tfp pilus assembly protein PilN